MGKINKGQTSKEFHCIVFLKKEVIFYRFIFRNLSELNDILKFISFEIEMKFFFRRQKDFHLHFSNVMRKTHYYNPVVFFKRSSYL